jgi:release factor glutamine methyltransferase
MKNFAGAIAQGAKIILKITSSKSVSRLEAESLMIHASGLSREKLYMSLADPVPTLALKKFTVLISKRKNRVPLQLLTGYASFYGRDFKVSKGVLIPRQDSETLIDAVISLKNLIPENSVAADCGTGSGILPVTLLKETNIFSKFYCFDTNSLAIKLCAENGSLYGVSGRMELLKGDFFRLAARLSLKYDIIVSNPPYIKKSALKGLQKEVLYDPVSALSDGADGYIFYRKFAALSPDLLKKDGFIAVEIGDGMGKRVKKIFTGAGWKTRSSFNDSSGKERAVVFSPPSAQIFKV